jgi:hypothetical protein
MFQTEGHGGRRDGATAEDENLIHLGRRDFEQDFVVLFHQQALILASQ